MQNRVMRPHWLELARRFQALAQNGLAYCKDPYDRERYEEIRRLAAEMMATGAGLRDAAPILNLFKTEVGYAGPMSVTPRASLPFAKLKRNPAMTSLSKSWRHCTTKTKIDMGIPRCHTISTRSSSYANFAAVRP